MKKSFYWCARAQMAQAGHALATRVAFLPKVSAGLWHLLILRHALPRALALLFMAAMPMLASAQSASSGVSQALNDWGKYLLWGAATVVTMVGAAVNMEKIIDKEGTGTRQQGIQNLAVIILFCLVAIAAVQFVSSQFNSLSF